MAEALPIFDPLPANGSDSAFVRLQNAARNAATWRVMYRPKTASRFGNRIQAASRKLAQLEAAMSRSKASSPSHNAMPAEIRTAWLQLQTNRRVLRGALSAVPANSKLIQRLPRAVYASSQDEPHVAALARTYLEATEGVFSPATLRYFVQSLQQHEPLALDELWSLSSFLQFALLESILRDAAALMRSQTAEHVPDFSARLESLLEINRTDWTLLIEPLIAFDEWLRQDPAGAFELMDFESRQQYRRKVASISRYSDCDEDEVAQAALDLARRGSDGTFSDARMQRRRNHIGYYLIEQGFPRLASLVGYHPPLSHRVLQFIRSYNEDFYIGGVLVLSILFIALILFPPLPEFGLIVPFILACLLLIPPAMQIAVEIANQAITAFYEPQALPKLDFSEVIPEECTTMVVIPSLLLSEKQVHELAQNLEVRYLANRNANLHFALLTDLADSKTKPREHDNDSLVDLAVQLINELNAKYGSQGKGSFLLLHRHRIFNHRQGVWMSWERKRGKMLDLNKLLMGEFDAFPIKAGPVELLKGIRFVLTLDSDTQLPHGSAARLIGAIAHPLNQAVIDPKLRIVTMGYGILQPRVGIAVRSTVRSRLAALFSGQSGIDLYTHATSDAYQDFFGEGIFAGKGIYEVSTFHAVLDHRFPRNALLSHDLIEGAYARVGLTSDIEVIDDYPSHYSAYTRRQHRWVRGDWQIAQWMFSIVPDEAARLGPNPITALSRWKIFDNLRRSLVDPALAMLLVAGWLGLPGGALYWTLATLFLLFFPVLIPFAHSMLNATRSRSKGQAADAVVGLARSTMLIFLRLVFLLHQTMLVIDAVFRSLFRRFVTGQRLLEWETAAQAEQESAPRAPTDKYLAAITLVAIALGAVIFLISSSPRALIYAAPILTLWALSSFFSKWLDSSPFERYTLRRTDVEYLRKHALQTWRYFSEFGADRHNHLIPDNVQEERWAEAPRVSPTNIGMLLNARQAACELGFLTIPDFVDLTRKTLGTIARLEKFRGHLYNWYDTHTLEALGNPPFLSSVDSGNFVASLYTLRGGVRELRRQPLIGRQLISGLGAHWDLICHDKKLPSAVRKLSVPSRTAPLETWLDWLPSAESALANVSNSESGSGLATWVDHTRVNFASLREMIPRYMPWTLSKFHPIQSELGIKKSDIADPPTIEQAIHLTQTLLHSIAAQLSRPSEDQSHRGLVGELQSLLVAAQENLRQLSSSLVAIEQEAESLASSTEFGFLVNRHRQVLSIGYNTVENRSEQASYDLFASEARIATFLAVARGDLRMQSWFKLEREHTYAFGTFVLASWTGTMFEYLMPSLWLRSYRGTLSWRTQSGAVQVQRAFAETLRLPWGISESGKAQRNDSGDYSYHAFGIPQIAINPEATAGPVISPYSTFLAVGIDPPEALRNLRRMEAAGWVGAYGFYEAADFTQSHRSPEMVRQWMAHHQGMSLLAITNLLRDDIFPRWFHSNPLIQAVEILLHESPISIAALKAQRREFASI